MVLRLTLFQASRAVCRMYESERAFERRGGKSEKAKGFTIRKMKIPREEERKQQREMLESEEGHIARDINMTTRNFLSLSLGIIMETALEWVELRRVSTGFNVLRSLFPSLISMHFQFQLSLAFSLTSITFHCGVRGIRHEMTSATFFVCAFQATKSHILIPSTAANLPKKVHLFHRIIVWKIESNWKLICNAEWARERVLAHFITFRSLLSNNGICDSTIHSNAGPHVLCKHSLSIERSPLVRMEQDFFRLIGIHIVVYSTKYHLSHLWTNESRSEPASLDGKTMTSDSCAFRSQLSISSSFSLKTINLMKLQFLCNVAISTNTQYAVSWHEVDCFINNDDYLFFSSQINWIIARDFFLPYPSDCHYSMLRGMEKSIWSGSKRNFFFWYAQRISFHLSIA